MNKSVLYHGKDGPLPGTRTLTAGPLTCLYENGDLRFIRCGATELIRRIYAAVRDRNWGTVGPELHKVVIADKGDSFTVSYQAVHRSGDIHFVWTGAITGSTDGTIEFLFNGECRSTFKKNRLGFCLLHPMTCAGASCTVTHTDDTVTDGIFPDLISPHQPFKDIRAITWQKDGLTARVDFSGEAFEMEDQRNWTDASYKTYCTPLDDPFPVTVREGDRIRQKITLRVDGCPPTSVTENRTDAVNVTYDTAREIRLPEIGLEMADCPLADRDVVRLQALRPGHLRVELHPDGSEDLPEKLEAASRLARQLDTRLLLAVFFAGDPDKELRLIEKSVRAVDPPVGNVLVFRTGEKSTTRETMTAVAGRLRVLFPGSPVGCGTDAFFTELNREHPPADLADFISYSLNPQVHAFDNTSLTETLPTQAETVRTARSFAHGKPVYVSPVSLRIRRNPNATGPEPPVPPDVLPPQADTRQMSLFGAGWTLGSIKYLSEAGVSSATYYHTTGIRGVLMPENGPAYPVFPAAPGTVFPLYHVLAAAGDAAGGVVIPCTVSDPLSVSVLLYRTAAGDLRAMLANHTDTPRRVRLPWTGRDARIKHLDERNAPDAMREPAAYRDGSGENIPLQDERLDLTLSPFGISFIS